MSAKNIQHYVHSYLHGRNTLNRGPNCIMPDDAAYTLAHNIANKLGENTSEDSFGNFITYYRELVFALDRRNYKNPQDVRNRYKDAGFDVNSLKIEMDAAIDELINKQTSTCYTKRPDVVDTVKNFYSQLLKDAINKTLIESRVESAPEPSVESVAESSVESAPEPSAEGGKKKKGGNKSAKKHTKNLCLKKSTQKKSIKKSTKGKSKCESVKGCKIASGTKRIYCRKSHNKSNKNN